MMIFGHKEKPSLRPTAPRVAPLLNPCRSDFPRDPLGCYDHKWRTSKVVIRSDELWWSPTDNDHLTYIRDLHKGDNTWRITVKVAETEANNP